MSVLLFFTINFYILCPNFLLFTDHFIKLDLFDSKDVKNEYFCLTYSRYNTYILKYILKTMSVLLCFNTLIFKITSNSYFVQIVSLKNNEKPLFKNIFLIILLKAWFKYYSLLNHLISSPRACPQIVKSLWIN